MFSEKTRTYLRRIILIVVAAHLAVAVLYTCTHLIDGVPESIYESVFEPGISGNPPAGEQPPYTKAEVEKFVNDHFPMILTFDSSAGMDAYQKNIGPYVDAEGVRKLTKQFDELGWLKPHVIVETSLHKAPKVYKTVDYVEIRHAPTWMWAVEIPIDVKISEDGHVTTSQFLVGGSILAQAGGQREDLHFSAMLLNPRKF